MTGAPKRASVALMVVVPVPGLLGVAVNFWPSTCAAIEAQHRLGEVPGPIYLNGSSCRSKLAACPI